MRNPIRALRKFLEAMKDQKLNRDYVGTDKYGNKYYQYYSPYGLPTRREIEYASQKRKFFFQDLAFFRWMVRQEELPPSEAEVKEYHRLEKERKKAGIEWDKKEEAMIEAFFRQKKEIGDKWKDAALPKGDFKPEGWMPQARRRNRRGVQPAEEDEEP